MQAIYLIDLKNRSVECFAETNAFPKSPSYEFIANLNLYFVLEMK